MNWDHFKTFMYVVGVIVYGVGFFMSMHDAIENGTSMEDFRKKFGKDLGKSLCLVYRTVVPALWPVYGVGSLLVGSGIDAIRLMTGRKPRPVSK